VLLLLAPVAPARGAELFVAGQQSQNVLAFDAGTGSFAGVFADTVDAGFSNPGGIALRPSDGALFVSSRGTGEIWRYDTATGAVVTPAVTTEPTSPNGIAFSASGARLYFADKNTLDSASVAAVT
jgi:sugar lactone lactonase YvrE